MSRFEQNKTDKKTAVTIAMKQLFEFINMPLRKIFIVMIFNIFEAFFAVSGIALLFPLIKFLQLGKDAFIAQMGEGPLHYLKAFTDYMHLDITLGLLILFPFLPILLQLIVRYLNETYTGHLQHDAIRQIREKLFKALLGADIDFYTKTELGDIANILTNNATLAGLNVKYIVEFWSFLIVASIYAMVLIVISPIFTLISVPIMLVIPLLMKRQASILSLQGKNTVNANARLYAYVVDKFKFIKKIFLLHSVKDEQKKFSETARDLEKATVTIIRTRSFITSSLEPMFFLAILIIMFIGVSFSKIDFGVLILFLYVIYRLTPQIKGAINCRSQILIYYRNFEKIKTMYEEIKRKTTIVSGRRLFTGLKRGLAFRNIYFRYDTKSFLFEHLSVYFEKNKTTALVGKSGSGKSTIVNLLLRFWDVGKGGVYVDDINIKELDLVSYRHKIGVVTQDAMLFYGTILDNITYGLSGFTKEEIDEACRMAHVDEFIEQMEKGYNTFIGESGTKLSGGQKQRIALAHLFLQHPEIIILDEPTSALDSESERFIKETLEDLKGNKTIIVVAHRLSTIKQADKIVVLENGTVREEGTYDLLVQNGGFFRNMVKLQKI
ncbi:MAG: ABC transporter ATP-binding protein [Candidatus Omnitrophica bacterium]|nr:ABC transporter ATP-binding protein [Candidatus Omnitrophota bacterium]